MRLIHITFDNLYSSSPDRQDEVIERVGRHWDIREMEYWGYGDVLAIVLYVHFFSSYLSITEM
jgi:hypothetical protein